MGEERDGTFPENGSGRTGLLPHIHSMRDVYLFILLNVLLNARDRQADFLVATKDSRALNFLPQCSRSRSTLSTREGAVHLDECLISLFTERSMHDDLRHCLDRCVGGIEQAAFVCQLVALPLSKPHHVGGLRLPISAASKRYRENRTAAHFRRFDRGAACKFAPGRAKV